VAKTLARNRRKAARFYFRFGISEATFRHGVPLVEGHSHLHLPCDPLEVAPDSTPLGNDENAGEAIRLPD
jgi:hypothetical protein